MACRILFEESGHLEHLEYVDEHGLQARQSGMFS